LRGAADTTLQKDVKETQPLVFQPLTSPFDFLTVENEIVYLNPPKETSKKQKFGRAACLLLFTRAVLYRSHVVSPVRRLPPAQA